MHRDARRGGRVQGSNNGPQRAPQTPYGQLFSEWPPVFVWRRLRRRFAGAVPAGGPSAPRRGRLDVGGEGASAQRQGWGPLKPATISFEGTPPSPPRGAASRGSFAFSRSSAGARRRRQRCNSRCSGAARGRRAQRRQGCAGAVARELRCQHLGSVHRTFCRRACGRVPGRSRGGPFGPPAGAGPGRSFSKDPGDVPNGVHLRARAPAYKPICRRR